MNFKFLGSKLRILQAINLLDVLVNIKYQF